MHPLSALEHGDYTNSPSSKHLWHGRQWGQPRPFPWCRSEFKSPPHLMLVMRIRTSYLTAWGLSFPFCKMGTRTGTQMFIIAYVMVSPHVQPHPGRQGSSLCSFHCPQVKSDVMCHLEQSRSQVTRSHFPNPRDSVSACCGPQWACRIGPSCAPFHHGCPSLPLSFWKRPLRSWAAQPVLHLRQGLQDV